jgi:hypothetical protein
MGAAGSVASWGRWWLKWTMMNRSTSREVAGGPPPRLLDELGDWTAGAGPAYRRLARALAGAIDRGTSPRPPACPRSGRSPAGWR